MTYKCNKEQMETVGRGRSKYSNTKPKPITWATSGRNVVMMKSKIKAAGCTDWGENSMWTMYNDGNDI
jgi:hypothetical protein